MFLATKQTVSFEETQQLGREFAAHLTNGDVLLLYGDLGSGKTTFMQGLAQGLGIERRIISPTFIIMRSYKIPDKDILYHIDLYRTATLHDLRGLGLPEILEGKNAIVAVEWPEKLGQLMPKKRWELRFNTVSDKKREISIQQYE